MKTTRFFQQIAMTAFTACAMTMGFASCSDDKEIPDSTPKTEVKTQEGDTNSEEMFRKLAVEMMTRSLCDIDSVGGTAKYTPTIGTPIVAATPTVLYAVANSVEEAEMRYQCIVSVLDTDTLSNDPMPHSVSEGDMHLTFTPGQEGGETGRISVECPRLKDVVSSVVFLSSDSWPQNDTPSPFNFLSVWYKKDLDRYYICLRDAKGGAAGIMLSLDPGTKGFELDNFHDSDWQDNFEMFVGCGLQEHFEILVNSMKWNENRWNAMFNKIAEKVPHRYQTYDMLDDIKNYPNVLRIFDCDYNWEKGRWWFAKNYYIDKRVVKIKNKAVERVTWHFEHESWPGRQRGSHYFKFYQSEKAKIDTDNNWVCILR